MIADAVMASEYTENRNSCNSAVADCVIYPCTALRHPIWVLNTADLLALLEERKVSRADIARAIKVTPSRVTEMYKGERAIKLDEAAKLVETFGLEQVPEADPLPLSIYRLAVRHIALRLKAPLSEPLLEDLAEDLLAFGRFAASPSVRQSVEAAEGFFRALQYRHREPEEGARPENGPEKTR